MKRKRVLKWVCIAAVPAAVIVLIIVFVAGSKGSSEDKVQFNAIIVDQLNDSSLVVYTEETKPGYEILTVSIMDHTKTDAQKLEIHQSICVTYDGILGDRGPPFAQADEIRLNPEPDDDMLKKADDFYMEYNDKTGFRQK